MFDTDFSKDFGMFTVAGNKRVATIVKRAHTKRWTWPETYTALEALSNEDKFGEAMDTEVREIVYSRCNFKTTFYI